MPIPVRVARWNKVGLNRVVRRIAPWLPGLGLVVHRGRKSGRSYQTPVTVFPTENGFIIALTYGAENTDWVKNVQAAGGCERGAACSPWTRREFTPMRPGPGSASRTARCSACSARPSSSRSQRLDPSDGSPASGRRHGLFDGRP
jgi:F420H(2)-dependent quinone reductase